MSLKQKWWKLKRLIHNWFRPKPLIKIEYKPWIYLPIRKVNWGLYNRLPIEFYSERARIAAEEYINTIDGAWDTYWKCIHQESFRIIKQN